MEPYAIISQTINNQFENQYNPQHQEHPTTQQAILCQSDSKSPLRSLQYQQSITKPQKSPYLCDDKSKDYQNLIKKYLKFNKDPKSKHIRSKNLEKSKQTSLPSIYKKQSQDYLELEKNKKQQQGSQKSQQALNQLLRPYEFSSAQKQLLLYDPQNMDKSKQININRRIGMPHKKNYSSQGKNPVAYLLKSKQQQKNIKNNFLNRNASLNNHNKKLLQPSQPRQSIVPSCALYDKKLSVAQSMRQQSMLEKDSYFDKYLTNSNMLNNYKIISHIGKGAFSIVSQAVDKTTRANYAIKTYNKITDLDWYKLDNIKKQISNLMTITHHNVISLRHVIKDKRKILLIMENGGKQSLAGILRKPTNLNNGNIKTRGGTNNGLNKIPENSAKFYFKQILEGIKHCHQNNVCHRDLKPENILIDDNGMIKIIDFGFSADSKQKLSTYCGTPPFMAPQITKKIPYVGQPADIWALGIILYLMLYGKFPFRSGDEKELYRLIQQAKYEVNDEISNPAKQILSKMLKANPQNRYNAQQLLNCTWIQSS